MRAQKYQQFNRRPEEKKDDYLVTGLREDTDDYRRNPISPSPQRNQNQYTTPDKGSGQLKYAPAERRGLNTLHHSYSKDDRIYSQATDPNVLSEHDVQRNMQEDPYLRYLNQSKKKYGHNVDLPHEQNDHR